MSRSASPPLDLACRGVSRDPDRPSQQARTPIGGSHMSGAINLRRRRFCGTAATTFAVAHLGMMGPAHAQPDKTKAAKAPTTKPGTHTSFASMKEIDAGVRNVAYAGAGPADGPVVMLLHGWPYDI